MNIHAFLVHDLQWCLFPLGFVGQRLTSRRKNRKVWAYLLQLFTQGVWIAYAFAIGQNGMSVGSFFYAGLYVWNYLEWKKPELTDSVKAAVRSLLRRKEKRELCPVVLSPARCSSSVEFPPRVLVCAG